MPEPVTVLGTAHGWLYGLFFLSAVDLALRAKWTLKGTLLTVLAGTVPFLSFCRRAPRAPARPAPASASDAAAPPTPSTPRILA